MDIPGRRKSEKYSGPKNVIRKNIKKTQKTILYEVLVNKSSVCLVRIITILRRVVIHPRWVFH